MRHSIVLVPALVLMIAGSISAAHPDQNFFIGPQIGLYSNDENDDDFNVMVGAAARTKFAPWIGLEGAINYRQESFADENLSVKSWPILVTGLFYPVNYIYATLGGGLYSTTFDFDSSVPMDDDTQNEFGWHIGGGVELPLGSRSLLTGDVRYVFLDYDFRRPPGFGEVDGDFVIITAGVLVGL